MASESVTTNHDGFFDLNASYIVDPQSTAAGLLDDSSCLMEAAIEIVNKAAIEIADKGSDWCANPNDAAKALWGAFYMMQMARNASNAALGRINAVKKAVQP